MHVPLSTKTHESESSNLYLPWMQTLSRHCEMRIYYYINGWDIGDLKYVHCGEPADFKTKRKSWQY